ncbi:hypothetical protein NC652_020420 [Populus alba x Populus x berolinensis]|uniref:Uncharacterized protein n=1 Tax=Populus alba x Populus x berolinensis TaxID=444605 RepID=A0AAD6MJY7_9ROSI|nr:hypothetical protein NC652_020420 [Populus alba x Populus x berolinensis]KAJ6986951.1 hypothetical protein NC653_020245 [Populus alba x Populus x berolinensis]
MSPSLTPSHDVTIISCLHEAASSPPTCPPKTSPRRALIRLYS